MVRLLLNLKSKSVITDCEVKGAQRASRKSFVMFVKDRMTSNPLTLPAEATISRVAMEMRRHKFRHFPITETTVAGEKLVGIVSFYDVARAFPDHLNPFSIEVFEETVPRKVSTIMSKKIIATTPDCPIEEAAEVLRSNKISGLPVLQESRLVGILTSTDVFQALVSMTAAKSGGVRVVIESENEANAVSTFVELSRQRSINILSIIGYREDRKTGKNTLILRFGSTLPPDFVQELVKHGFRVSNVSLMNSRSSSVNISFGYSKD
jgi:acetoin utilization protein AcuB